MKITGGIKRSCLAAIVVVVVMVLAPSFSPSAQSSLRIAIRLKDLPVGQLLAATGRTASGSITCHGVTLNAPRIFLISAREGDDADQLMYFEQGTGAGAKYEIAKLVSDEACAGPEGVNFWLYEVNPLGR